MDVLHREGEGLDLEPGDGAWIPVTRTDRQDAKEQA